MYPQKMERLKNGRRWGRGAYSRNSISETRGPQPPRGRKVGVEPWPFPRAPRSLGGEDREPPSVGTPVRWQRHTPGESPAWGTAGPCLGKRCTGSSDRTDDLRSLEARPAHPGTQVLLSVHLRPDTLPPGQPSSRALPACSPQSSPQPESLPWGTCAGPGSPGRVWGHGPAHPAPPLQPSWPQPGNPDPEP